MEVAGELAVEVGTKPACEALAVPRSSFYRRRIANHLSLALAPRPTPARALSEPERMAVLDVLHQERFWNASPYHVHAVLLDEGVYLCSVRTMYRILSCAGEVEERRNHRSRSGYAKPELLATCPNEVWSWDITRLKGPAKWVYFYLYVIMDIFSRYVVGWMVACREAATLARRLIEETCRKQDIRPGQLTVHADRGSSMKSKTVAQLMDDLCVHQTHSRPYTSNDNPYSEAQFKTLKYHPGFPERFGCAQDARIFCQDFFSWYNTEHRHSGIAYLTPDMVHHGNAGEVIQARQFVLLDAFAAHPERFVNKVPQPAALPESVWINPPKPSLEIEKKEVVLP